MDCDRRGTLALRCSHGWQPFLLGLTPLTHFHTCGVNVRTQNFSVCTLFLWLLPRQLLPQAPALCLLVRAHAHA